jgi:hypothetical protein
VHSDKLSHCNNHELGYCLKTPSSPDWVFPPPPPTPSPENFSKPKSASNDTDVHFRGLNTRLSGWFDLQIRRTIQNFLKPPVCACVLERRKVHEISLIILWLVVPPVSSHPRRSLSTSLIHPLSLNTGSAQLRALRTFLPPKPPSTKWKQPQQNRRVNE